MSLAQDLRELDQRPPGADEALAALDRDARAVDVASRGDGNAAYGVFAAARLRETANSMASVLDLPACRGLVGLPSRSTTSRAAPLGVSLECVNDPAALAKIGPGSPLGSRSAAAPVECKDAHQFEQYLKFDSPGGPATPFPGDVMLADYAARQCGEAFAGYVGRSPASWNLSYASFPPDAADWAGGRRSITCLAFDPERDTVEGPMVKPGS